MNKGALEDRHCQNDVESLVKKGHNILGVFCPLYENKIHARLETTCNNYHISFKRVSEINSDSFYEQIREIQIDLIIICHFKKLISANGEGFETLKEAKSNGQGAIIVSAHFGQWEAIRHHLAENNMETGAVYRKNNNPLYERLFLKSIKLNTSELEHLMGGKYLFDFEFWNSKILIK